MRPNWFIGLRVPAGDWFASQVREPPEGVRVFAPGDLHLTVAFLGAVDEAAARCAWEARHLGTGPPLRVSLDAVLPMGPPRRFSALSAHLSAGRDETSRLIERLRGPMLELAGARPDARPARPHVTLARVRRRAGPAERRRAVNWAAGLDLRATALQLGELALFTWAEDRTRTLFRVMDSQSLA